MANKAFIYRIYPDKNQEQQLQKTFGCCRFVYNSILALQEERYKAGEKHLSKTEANSYCNRVLKEDEADTGPRDVQLSMFDDAEEIERRSEEEKAALEKERRIQEAEIALKKKFGKNAIIKGMNLQKGSTAIERNRQVGGHRAGEKEK